MIDSILAINAEEVTEEKNKYITLKERILRIITALEKSADDILKASNGIGEYYSLNGSSADNNRLTTEREKLLETRNNLKNSVLPAINNKLDEINILL